MLKEEIIEWVKEQPYWLQVGSNLIFKGEEIDDEKFNNIYLLFKRESGLLKEPLKKENLPFLTVGPIRDSYSKAKWKSVSNVQGVNALKEGQSLDIGGQLTIVYGNNGSGKSGYTRLFNNAFLSRGDKKILSNIFKNNKIKPSASFEFINEEDKTAEISFPKDRNNYLFNTVSVFDTVSAMHDLTEEDELAFVPIEFNFFDKLISIFSAVKEKLNEEIGQKNKVNNFGEYFDKDTSVKLAVEKIDGQSNYDEIKLIADVSTLDMVFKDKVKRKRQLLSLNIDERLAELNNIKQYLEILKERIQKLNSKFSAERVDKIQGLLMDRIKLKRMSAKEGLSQFKNEHIYELGSSEWKKFVLAADTYYKSIDQEIDNCIFCGQTIEKVTVIDKYWKYLKSSAEINLSTAELNIKKIKVDFENQDLTLIVKKTKLDEWLNKNQLDLYEKIMIGEKKFNAVRSDIVENLSSLEWDKHVEPYKFDDSWFDSVFKTIESDIKNLDANKVNQELSEIETYINEYNDKLKLGRLLPDIKEYVSCMNWVDSARKISLSTQQITTFQNKLFSKYVSKEYIEHFRDECQRLNANFSAEIQQRGRRGATLSKLTISGGSPTEVLSEGEQRSVALANFLAEMSLNDNNECLVFDDPVSSLDNERRDVIAKRLVEKATEKQVVILTHDITFFLIIQDYCRGKVDCKEISIRSWHGESGIVQNIPWIALPVGKRVNRLRENLQSIKSFYEKDISDSPNGLEEYRSRAKGWCELLRETWEKTVEEILFNNAIQRLNPAIQTQRLKKATYTKDLYVELESGMAKCSNWVHDRASEMGENTPTPEELDGYLNDCKEFIASNRPK